MQSLAVKYRPKKFEDVVSQKSVIKILQRQIETNKIVNCYLFCGPSGTGKTTLARIFANEVNHGAGMPIEIDGASNNGVDNVRTIIDNAKDRALDATYKVFIIDEVHMLTTAAWNAFLKCIEEPPRYTIFIFCTTDPQKIPATILNRVMRFNLTKISTQEIKNRLLFVCQQENCTNYEESIDYISKIANGGMRDALAMLDKCLGYSNDLSINNVLSILGVFSYEVMFDLINDIIDRKEDSIINIIEKLYNDGYDLKQFVELFLDFCLDISKFCIFKDMNVVKIPTSFKDNLLYTIGPDLYSSDETNGKACIKYFNSIVDKLLKLKQDIKFDANIKNTTLIELLQLARG